LKFRSNYQKFQGHLKAGGIFYALWRGLKYFAFVVKIKRGQGKKLPKPGLICGRTRLMMSAYGVKIFWENKEMTEGVGLNSAINILGMWSDSSKADWQVQESSRDSFVLGCRWRDLPITQRWSIKLKSETKIVWKIDMDIEEDLEFDKKEIAIFVSPEYRKRVSSYEQGDFTKKIFSGQMKLNNCFSRSIGIKPPKGKEFLPSLLLEFRRGKDDISNLFVQNDLEQNKTFSVGVEIAKKSGGKYFLPGSYKLFSGEITLFEDEKNLDIKLQKLRQEYSRNLQSNKFSKGKKMRIILANMPWEKEGCWGVRAGSRWPHIKDKTEGNYLPFPFFLAYAASLLKKEGFEVKVIDALAEQMTEKDFLRQVDEFQPDLLLSEISTVSLEDDLTLLEKIHKDILIAICGPDINIRRSEFLRRHGFIDYVLVGEYESTLLDLVQHLSRNKDLKEVLGLIYRKGGEIKINPSRPLVNLDILPWPVREELPMQKYWDLPGNIPFPSVQMLASRGCPFKCIFCLWPQVMYQGSDYRVRDPIKVIDEMEYLVKNMNFKSVYFDDDTWNIGKERILKLCDEIKRRNLQNIPWAIMARPDLMDKEILMNLKGAGLWSVKYGVESGVQKLVNNANKNMDLKKAKEMIKFTKKLGIKTHLTFTFGLPGENKETIDRTINCALALDPDSVQFSIVTPFPGTEYFHRLDREGNIVTKDWSHYDGNYKSVLQLDSLTSQDLEDAKRKAYLIWGKHKRTKKSFLDNAKEFKKQLKKYGLHSTLQKTAEYFKSRLTKN